MLSETGAKRRIRAARDLRGLTQEDMDALAVKDGLGRQELSRTERGELPLTRVRALVLSRVLRLPVEWFLVAEITDIIAPSRLSGDQDERLRG